MKLKTSTFSIETCPTVLDPEPLILVKDTKLQINVSAVQGLAQHLGVPGALKEMANEFHFAMGAILDHDLADFR